ncbi:MAG TPA: hypothetical protein VGB77_20990 [Abditibacteriaceae bacterium]|jgi:hypothetical protein
MKTLLCALAGAFSLAGTAQSQMLDTLKFGDGASETAHQIVAVNSDVISGGLSESARRFLPNNPADWQGGKVSFVMKVDPQKENYFTVKFWGNEINANRMALLVDGKMIGYRHIGDIDQLDFGTEHAPYKGRFYYNTFPLPLSSTRGKTQINCDILSSGPIWAYGTNFEQYQKPMTEPSRALYSIYTHLDGFFVPPANEKQGSPPKAQKRIAPGPEVLQQAKERVNRDVKNLLASTRPLNQVQMEFIARAYFVKWTQAYQNPQAITRILQSLDATYNAWKANPKLAEAEPSTYNPDWFGLGLSGRTIALLQKQLAPFFDAKIENGEVTRRTGWTEMLVASRNWHRYHRRLYTNQSMINDTYGIYLSNRGVAALAPDKAMPENAARRYLYESLGLEPWRDSDPDPNATTAPRNWGIGPNYFQLTAKGLTKELGYVGYYGEVLDWVTKIYDATRPAHGETGDLRIREQAIKIARARAPFRYPSLDDEGNAAMVGETIVGWRDAHYGSDVIYGQRTSWDGSPLEIIAATLDPQLIGYAQQMFEDNQYFPAIGQRLKDKGFRVTAGLLETPDEYELIKAQAPVTHRLPMASGQPDFVFSDEEIGVLALKNGADILYVSLYWRARNAINHLARVHYITPNFDRVATVREQTQFTPSGLLYKRSKATNAPWGPWLPRYPNEDNSAHAGEELPIAKIPEGIEFKPGQESVYAGKGDFYRLRYGPYLIGMNMTTDKTFDLVLPQKAKELVSQTNAPGGAVKKVGPRSTVVFYLSAN